MHSKIISNFTFFHNGDYSGDVEIINRTTEERFSIPFERLKTFVAEWVRTEKISKLEQMEDDEILLFRTINPPSQPHKL